ncbi:type II toxin-antitoxin system VapC family toxin [Propioniciclava coleopterorum]|uniref:Type II toxin-antitoxin system VapC family toxin n=1 Tax=Propioniciclava coleopterorum TaxID=2714937 RepID=A0A6G7Y4Y9_9ACTN|nr:type II toxin-antitoxin system VapC family toxin [Propioniciclava coleopterorum]QIK71779.1 type II toxin-antitoxin system VapC family toxin [Propioniciclava coleopterorum]
MTRPTPPDFEPLGELRCHDAPPGREPGPALALFRGFGAEFVLVPGGEVELGWTEPRRSVYAGMPAHVVAGIEADLFGIRHPLEGHRRWLADAEASPDTDPMLLAWLRDRVAVLAAEPDADPELADAFTLDAYGARLAQNLSPARRAEIGPMLVERVPRPIGRRRLGTYDDATGEHTLDAEHARQALAAIERLGPIEGNGSARLVGVVELRRRPSGDLEVFWEEETTHPELVDALAADGFALPTEDEWEYLCGGGSRTLFRWGDADPGDTTYGYGSEPDVLIEPNRMGVQIAWDQFKQEVTADPALAKGGDGGGSLHDDVGWFHQTVPLSTFHRSWADPRLGENLATGYYVHRRIVRL